MKRLSRRLLQALSGWGKITLYDNHLSSPVGVYEGKVNCGMEIQMIAKSCPWNISLLRFQSSLSNEAEGRVARSCRKIVPDSAPPAEHDLKLLHKFVENSKSMVVMTGAGISTESGIPDYRGPNGAYSSGFKPITHQEFIKFPKCRERYWVRSYIGWRRFIGAQPGPTHKTLAQLESRGHTIGIITQNVDRLHHKAGSNPIELHGTTHEVICLNCSHVTSRHIFQQQFKLLNEEWALVVETLENGTVGSDASFGMRQRPDGDIEIDESILKIIDIQIPSCEQCGGILKPDVVMFGDNVPRSRADAAMNLVGKADAMLIIGSSVMVMSAFRLVSFAHRLGIPICILNIGPTRADDIAFLKIQVRSGEILPRLLDLVSFNV